MFPRHGAALLAIPFCALARNGSQEVAAKRRLKTGPAQAALREGAQLLVECQHPRVLQCFGMAAGFLIAEVMAGTLEDIRLYCGQL